MNVWVLHRQADWVDGTWTRGQFCGVFKDSESMRKYIIEYCDYRIKGAADYGDVTSSSEYWNDLRKYYEKYNFEKNKDFSKHLNIKFAFIWVEVIGDDAD